MDYNVSLENICYEARQIISQIPDDMLSCTSNESTSNTAVETAYVNILFFPKIHLFPL